MLRSAVLLALLLAGAPAAARPAEDRKPADNPWTRARRPSAGPARSVGGYSAGCLAGAARLPARGKGFRVAEAERRRFYGHPALVDFIRQLGRQVHAAGLGVMPVGDLSQPRGGPAPGGHASHQTGLDADIWYADGAAHRGSWPPKKVAMVDLDRKAPTAAFDGRVAQILTMAAADVRVDRLFVNPVIKRELCTGAGTERAWLRKVRPWWLHHEHFHVRLACPADSPGCRPQGPIPDGDGCGEVARWLEPKPEEEAAAGQRRKDYRSRQGVVPVLPGPCTEIVPK